MIRVLFAGILAVLFFMGCGGSSNVGIVSGVVTLDGLVIPGATVSFHPTSGRGSVGVTDDRGRYELRYVRNENGAVIGSHKVTISTEIHPEEAERGVTGYDENATSPNPTPAVGRAETLPPKYRDLAETELTAEVKSGANEIDFALTSDN